MADIKISQLTPKNSAIANTDLIEISESNGVGGYVTKSVTGANILSSKQDTLISGTNIKTINSTTILGSGDLTVQPTLLSGTNIKTINSNSILGSGNLVISSGVTSVSATTPVVATGTTTPVISLASNYGDTQNPYASKTANNILAAPNGSSGVPTFRAIVGEDIPTLNQNTTGTASNVTGIVAVANGGTGTATPSLVAGTGVTITGTFPNQTINSSGGGGGGTQIGDLIGGGIVVAVFNQSGVSKALVASLTNLSTGIQWTIPAFQTTQIGAPSRSYFNGLTNTNAIIAQTGAAATTLYAAGLARLFAGGGFSDWYLPSMWELNMCYNSATVVNIVLGANGFTSDFYWTSTEAFGDAKTIEFASGGGYSSGKVQNFDVRAVRIHTI
jgi:hypothetical protein